MGGGVTHSFGDFGGPGPPGPTPHTPHPRPHKPCARPQAPRPTPRPMSQTLGLTAHNPGPWVRVANLNPPHKTICVRMAAHQSRTVPSPCYHVLNTREVLRDTQSYSKVPPPLLFPSNTTTSHLAAAALQVTQRFSFPADPVGFSKKSSVRIILNPRLWTQSPKLKNFFDESGSVQTTCILHTHAGKATPAHAYANSTHTTTNTRTHPHTRTHTHTHTHTHNHDQFTQHTHAHTHAYTTHTRTHARIHNTLTHTHSTRTLYLHTVVPFEDSQSGKCHAPSDPKVICAFFHPCQGQTRNIPRRGKCACATTSGQPLTLCDTFSTGRHRSRFKWVTDRDLNGSDTGDA